MGFAIPIEGVVEKAEQMINGEDSSYPHLGIEMYDVQTALRNPLYSPYIPEDITSGVIISKITAGSSAAQAKLQVGDIITKINDAKISNSAYLRYELYKYKFGDTIKITFIRSGKENTVSIKLTTKAEN